MDPLDKTNNKDPLDKTNNKDLPVKVNNKDLPDRTNNKGLPVKANRKVLQIASTNLMVNKNQMIRDRKLIFNKIRQKFRHKKKLPFHNLNQ